MTTAVMQPYFFPYLGYFQMFAAVDKFVLLDDVNYIMKGYINRNSILLNGEAHRFTIPIEKASRNKLICETSLTADEEWKGNLLNTIRMAYLHAPQFGRVFPVIEGIVNFRERDLTKFILHSFVEVKSFLHLDTEIYVSSQIAKDNSLRAQDRILEICRQVGTNKYINAIGGQTLYSPEMFRGQGIELKFIKMEDGLAYRQFSNPFVPNLSFIDVLMFNGVSEVADLLNRYSLI
ncbi:MAG: WbqC family protein [Victivallales bacterium]|nr:WbqC family protein [Victivallales bacterium]